MENRRATTLWLLVALAVFGVATVLSRRPPPPPPPSRPSWQHPVTELSAPQQAFFERLREQLRVVERARSESQQWPERLDGFPLRQRGITVNYVGEREGLRWLVLYLEPDPRLPKEPAPPEDDEHHTLPDGTPLHVTVWTQPLSEPAPTDVTAFPAAEGWVERVRR